MKAFEYKLSRRMSMIDAGSNSEKINTRYLSSKAQNISMWLEKSTQMEWNEMKQIRARLERLEKEKKSLI